MYCIKCGASISEKSTICCKCHSAITFNYIPELASKYKEDPLSYLPENMAVELNGDTLVLTYKWYYFNWLLSFCFSLFFISGLTVIYLGGAGIPSAVFILLLLVSVLILYGSFSTFINKTVIRLNDTNISISNGPLPGVPEQNINISDIHEVCSEKCKSDSYTHHSVNIILKNNKKIVILYNLPEMSQALFIENQIAKNLIHLKPLESDFF
mgnify:CR=1 FL=1